MKTRQIVQQEALQALKDNNYSGTIVLSVGTGKSKVAIDAIKEGKKQIVLIVSPRENLKENWKKELEKWKFEPIENRKNCYEYKETTYYITVENIQTAYKYHPKLINSLDLLIVDEIHTVAEEYFHLIELAKEYQVPIIGLTGTPNKKDEFKRDVLYKELPIIYEYLDSAEDGIVNKINYYLYQYELTDDYKVVVGTKDKKWLTGELKQYTYLEQQYELAKGLMWELGATDYFTQSLLWMREGNIRQKEAGRKFFYAIKNRKDFLWNLSSSVDIATKIKNGLLANKDNKILLFSELTQQSEKLSPYNIHSKTGDTAKKTLEQNTMILEKFNKGEIRELSSCLSLTLGLNLTQTNWAIFESFSGSDTNSKQKSGRLNRLKVDDIANVLVILPVGTQAEQWYANAFNHAKEFINIKDINKILKL